MCLHTLLIWAWFVKKATHNRYIDKVSCCGCRQWFWVCLSFIYVCHNRPVLTLPAVSGGIPLTSQPLMVILQPTRHRGDVCSQVTDLQPFDSPLTFSALLPPLSPRGANNPGNKQQDQKGTGWLPLWLHTEWLVWLAGQLESITCNDSQAPKLELFKFYKASNELLHLHIVSSGDSCYAHVIMLTG